jgi:hypothetical protein
VANELQAELLMHFRVHKQLLLEFLKIMSRSNLAYLAYIFSHLNDLDITLQRHDKNILIVEDRVNAFIKKLYSWVTHL